MQSKLCVVVAMALLSVVSAVPAGASQLAGPNGSTTTTTTTTTPAAPTTTVPTPTSTRAVTTTTEPARSTTTAKAKRTASRSVTPATSSPVEICNGATVAKNFTGFVSSENNLNQPLPGDTETLWIPANDRFVVSGSYMNQVGRVWALHSRPSVLSRVRDGRLLPASDRNGEPDRYTSACAGSVGSLRRVGPKHWWRCARHFGGSGGYLLGVQRPRRWCRQLIFTQVHGAAAGPGNRCLVDSSCVGSALCDVGAQPDLGEGPAGRRWPRQDLHPVLVEVDRGSHWWSRRRARQHGDRIVLRVADRSVAARSWPGTCGRSYI